MRRPHRRALLPVMAAVMACTLAVFPGFGPARAQPAPVVQVFHTGGPDAGELVFLDPATGQTDTTRVSGERFTPLGDRVLYWDAGRREVREARPGRPARAFALIAASLAANPEPPYRIDWAVSSDASVLAWTVTRGPIDALITETYTGPLPDGPPRRVWADGPHAGVRAFPLGFNPAGTHLYMDYQPDTIAAITPFRQYASLFALELASATTRALPGEPGCFCGGAVQADEFLRLALAPEGGFIVRTIALDSGGGFARERDLSPAPGGYDLTGDVLIAPDGTHAVYALARVRGFGTDGQTLETQFMLVDLVAFEQRPFFPPVTDYLRPVAWTDDGSAVLFTSPTEPGTWKARIDERSLVRVAGAAYVGQLGGDAAAGP
jgi:hypothetical protein